jgi:hypothetical protein
MKRLKRTFSFLSGFFLVGFSQNFLWAWGPVGHDVVALIADSRLSPDAKKQIAAILGPDASLEDIANCADWIKYAKQPVNCADFSVSPMPETSRWHFIDIPINAADPSGAISSACGQHGDCSVDQIQSHLAVLADTSADLAQRQLALMFVTHLLGDLHQPLHNATEILPDGTTDRGGNLKKMTFESDGNVTNLHALWDDLIESQAGKKTMDPKALAKNLEDGISNEDAATWSQASLQDMALEGYQIAQSQIYPDYHVDGGNVVTQDYEDQMRPVAYLCLKKAGVRLAALLNKAFALPQSPVPNFSYDPILLRGKLPAIERMLRPATAGWVK